MICLWRSFMGACMLVMLLSTQINAMLNIRLLAGGEPGALQINNFTWTRNGQFLIVTKFFSQTCFIWKNNGEQQDSLQAAGIITSIASSPTDPDILALGLENGTIELWNIKQKQKTAQLCGKHFVEKMIWSQDGLTLFSLSKSQTDSYLNFWSLAKSKLLKQQIISSEIVGVQWPLNRTLIVAEKQTGKSILGLYDVDLEAKAITPVKQLNVIDDLSSIGVSSDYKSLCAYFMNGTISLYNQEGIKTHNWQSLLRATFLTDCVLSPQNSSVITSGLDELVLYDIKLNIKKKLLGNLSELCQILKKNNGAHQVPILNAQESPDTESILAYIKTPAHEPLIAKQFAWSPDNKYLAVGLKDNKLSIFSHFLVIIDMEACNARPAPLVPAASTMSAMPADKKEQDSKKIDPVKNTLKQKLQEKPHPQKSGQADQVISSNGKYAAALQNSKKEYPCNQCKKVFSRVYDLLLHQKSEHKK